MIKKIEKQSTFIIFKHIVNRNMIIYFNDYVKISGDENLILSAEGDPASEGCRYKVESYQKYESTADPIAFHEIFSFRKEIYGEIELQILIPTERAMGMFVKDNIGDGISRGYSHAIIEETLKKTYLDNLKNKGTL